MSDRSPSSPRGIDPRGPRFAAAITSALLAIAVLLGLTGLSAYRPTDFAYVEGGSTFDPGWAVVTASIGARLADPAFLLLALVAALFLWGVVSPTTAPWGVLFRRIVRPRLAPPTDLEDPRPPRFAQGVGLFVVTVGLVLHLAGVPLALPIAAGAAFIAAFLNAAFGLCLGCQLYLLLQRGGLVGRARPAH